VVEIKQGQHEPLSKPARVTRYRRFESGFIQQRVCEPTTPTIVGMLSRPGRLSTLTKVQPLLGQPVPSRTTTGQGGAECVFVFGADKRTTRDIVADIRGRAAAHGRDPRDILLTFPS
jgi:alkanesulfonate monooxygenase SsuD/methylene tetrahydromethanopterin reductase-like flavin-dependent oxidoreductase (luciferase family)